MNIVSSIIQAIVQGLTEFLPVSSSGHLALTQYFTDISPEEGTFFTAMMHLGTLVAVFVAFWGLIKELIIEGLKMLGDIFTGKFKIKELNPNRRMILMLLLSTAPLFVILPFKDYYDILIAQGNMFFLGGCFLFTSLVLFIADKTVKGTKTKADIKAKDSIIIGIAQGIAVLPGISRSGSTVAASLIVGLTRETAVAYSFILGIPAILGAGILEVKEAVETSANVDILAILIGIVVSGIVGYFSIKMIAWIIKTDKYKYFVYYTLAVGLFTIGIGLYELFV